MDVRMQVQQSPKITMNVRTGSSGSGEYIVPHIGANGNWYVGDIDTGVRAQGEPGIPGTSPHIGENGNWFIGDTDTGVKAQGEPGQPGTSPHIGENGNWYVGENDTGVPAQGDDYVLTDADKTEIAQAVIALLPKYNGEVEDV